MDLAGLLICMFCVCVVMPFGLGVTVLVTSRVYVIGMIIIRFVGMLLVFVFVPVRVEKAMSITLRLVVIVMNVLLTVGLAGLLIRMGIFTFVTMMLVSTVVTRMLDRDCERRFDRRGRDGGTQGQ